jgi:hypothetical protein
MKISFLNNGGFPPLILKKSKKSSNKNNNKERTIAADIKTNVNIRQILQTNNTENILDTIKQKKDDLEEVDSL